MAVSFVPEPAEAVQYQTPVRPRECWLGWSNLPALIFAKLTSRYCTVYIIYPSSVKVIITHTGSSGSRLFIVRTARYRGMMKYTKK